MHNKLFIADGAFGLIGGRNVANEYYLRKDSDNFIDVDALVNGRMQLIWGRVTAFADHPSKPFQGAAGGELRMSSVTYSVFQAMAQAQHEVLASTDEPVVHLAYARCPLALLEQGVELYELSQRRVKDNMRMLLFGASLGRLHAKTVVIDQRLTYIGSMNLDPRSATINTELGALIDSAALAAEMSKLIDIDRLQSAYRLRLSRAGGCCEWVVPDSDEQVVITLEPDSAWWMRWLGSLLQPVTPEDHL